MFLKQKVFFLVPVFTFHILLLQFPDLSDARTSMDSAKSSNLTVTIQDVRMKMENTNNKCKHTWICTDTQPLTHTFTYRWQDTHNSQAMHMHILSTLMSCRKTSAVGLTASVSRQFTGFNISLRFPKTSSSVEVNKDCYTVLPQRTWSTLDPN